MMTETLVNYRNLDVILDSNDLELIYTIKQFPIFMGCVNDDSVNDKFFDMNFCISKSSGIIQLNPIVSLEEVYRNSHGSGKIGKLWIEHNCEFSKFIKKYNPKSVLEIGGGSGNLSKSYHEKYGLIDWTIVEPNSADSSNLEGVHIIREFFNENSIIDHNVDAVLHSHVIEHILYPNDFLRLIRTYLHSDKKMIFSVPNLKEMFSRYYTNCINFEHTILLTDDYIDFLLMKNNFKIIEKVFFKQDHSIFYAVEAAQQPPQDCYLNPDSYKTNKDALLKYIKYIENLILTINKNIKNQQDIYLFGGHIFSQFLIYMGLDVTNIKCILDNDGTKHDKRLYGTNLIVSSPKILKGVKNPKIILCVATYRKEIESDILTNINKDAIFIHEYCGNFI